MIGTLFSFLGFFKRFSPRQWIMVGAAAAVAVAVGWVVLELRAGVRAKAEAERLTVELDQANDALEDERELLDKRTRDLMLQIDLLSRAEERRESQAQEAEALEERLGDFGEPVPVPPLVDRTLKELFP